MRYRVTHRTSYSYDQTVNRSVNVARLVPRETPQQQVWGAYLEVDPLPDQIVERVDFFGNRTHYVSLEAGFTRLDVVAHSEVEVTAAPAPEGEAAARSWEGVAEMLATTREPEVIDARQFAFASPLAGPDPSVDDYAQVSFPPERPLVEAVVDLTRRIHADFEYARGVTTTSTSPLEVLRGGKGVCQDFAHFALACLRGRGLAARYVSGYLETAPPEGRPRLTGSAASHAWVGVWLPGHGWLEVDPTNDLVVGDRHVTAAWGRDYRDVSPLKGVIFWEGKEQRLEVSVDVERA